MLVTEMSYFKFTRRGTNLKEGSDVVKYFLFGLLFHCVHYICNGTRVFFFKCCHFAVTRLDSLFFVAALVTNRVIRDISSFVPDLM